MDFLHLSVAVVNLSHDIHFRVTATLIVHKIVVLGIIFMGVIPGGNHVSAIRGHASVFEEKIGLFRFFKRRGEYFFLFFCQHYGGVCIRYDMKI